LLVTIIFFKAKLIGSNYLIHHLIVFFSGVLIAFFAYKILRLKNISHTNSLIGALVLFTGNAYGEIYWRLICGEGPGLFFYVIGLYYTLSYFNQKSSKKLWLSILFLTAAALTKESFILLLPIAYLIPLIGANSILEAQQLINDNKKIYTIALSVFTILMFVLIFMILTAVKIFDYGSPLSLKETIINNFVFVCKWFIPFTPIVGLALFFMIKNKSYRLLLQLAILTFCWVTAHLIVYHKVIISFSMGKYIMPGGLVFIGIIALSLEYIKSNSNLGFKFCLLLMSFLLVRNAKITYIMANEYAAKVSAFNQLIDQSVQKKQSHIAIYGGIEIYLSLDSQFKNRNYFPKIYSSKVVYNRILPANEFQNQDYEDAMFESIALDFPTKTLAQLGQDSTVKTLIVAEPVEVEEIDEEVVLKYFPHKIEIVTAYNNPKFSDLINPACWKGELNNSKVTYLYFTK
jgi:hypothetical protein